MKKKADWKLHRKKKKKKDFATTTFLPQKKEVLLVTSATQKAIIALSFARTNERTRDDFAF